jgi:hypothetical protein
LRPKPLSGFRFPRGLPDRAEALAVRRSADRSLRPAPTFSASWPKPKSRKRRDPRPKPRFRLTVHGPKSWVPPGFAAPGPKPGPARQFEAEAPPRRWRRANRSSASAGRVLGPKARCPACGLQACPKAAWSPCGRLTKHAAFASAKGQARSFRLAAASSAALPPLSPASPPEGGSRLIFGCGWEGFPPLPGDRLGHQRKLSWNPIRTKRIRGRSGCG